jgi:hypothetical protein
MNFGGAGAERVSTRAINRTHEAGQSPWTYAAWENTSTVNLA